MDETLGDVRQRRFSLYIARHHIALHHIPAFPIAQLFGLEHDAVKVVLIGGCYEVDVLQGSIAIQVFGICSLHMDIAIERKTFTDMFIREIQIVRSKVLKYYIQINILCRTVCVGEICICLHVLIVNASSTRKLC